MFDDTRPEAPLDTRWARLLFLARRALTCVLPLIVIGCFAMAVKSCK